MDQPEGEAAELDAVGVALRLRQGPPKVPRTAEQIGDPLANVIEAVSLPTGVECEPESSREVVWTLKKVGDAWKISDIAAPKSDWKVSEFDCTSPQ